MNRHFLVWTGFLAVGVWWHAAATNAQVPPNPAPPPPPLAGASQEDGVEVMTRGPVHEAYAGPVARGEGAPVVVTKRPPDAIEELPPDSKPEGNNVAWISGYWSWDEDRKDFIWVSGVWRTVPVNQTWVPGYWTETDGGYRWVSGFWMSQQNEEVQYLAEPPASVEQGPASPAPSDDHFWNPGYWLWHETRYVWRPGFWTVCRPDWIWVPARYCWTPRGWVFIDGYWDYPLVRRGVLFAPVCFRRPLLHWDRFRFFPAIVIEPSILNFHLFIRANFGHYYFGDYYAVAYEGMGFRPWFHYHGPRGFDPLFNYYRWYNGHHLRDRDWERNVQGWFSYYRHNERERPPHTLLAQQLLAGKAQGRPDFQHLLIGKPIKELAGRKDSFVKLTTISETQRRKITEASRQIGDFRKVRLELESQRGKPDTRLIGKPGLSTSLGVTGKPDGKGGKPAQASNLTFKQPEKVRLPKKLDLGSLGAGQLHGPTVSGPGKIDSKLGTTLPKMDATLPKVTRPEIKRDLAPPKIDSTLPKIKRPEIKPDLPMPKTGVTLPKTGVTLPKTGATLPKTGVRQPSGSERSGRARESDRDDKGKGDKR